MVNYIPLMAARASRHQRTSAEAVAERVNTPAHVVFSLSLLGHARAARYALAIAVGAVAPDLLIILFYGWEKLRDVPEQVIWEQHYYLPFWQGVFDTANSIPLIPIAH